MTTLLQLARKLRMAADVLDDLLGTVTSTRTNETPATAEKIRATFKRQPPSQRGKKYAPGTHWTQTPAGRARMRRIQKERYAKIKAASLKVAS
jgi:hypothetical protein